MAKSGLGRFAPSALPHYKQYRDLRVSGNVHRTRRHWSIASVARLSPVIETQACDRSRALRVFYDLVKNIKACGCPGVYQRRQDDFTTMFSLYTWYITICTKTNWSWQTTRDSRPSHCWTNKETQSPHVINHRQIRTLGVLTFHKAERPSLWWSCTTLKRVGSVYYVCEVVLARCLIDTADAGHYSRLAAP